MTKNEKKFGYSSAKIATIVSGLMGKDLAAKHVEHAKKPYARITVDQKNELPGYMTYQHVLDVTRPDRFDQPITEARADGIVQMCKKLIDLDNENKILKAKLSKVQAALN